MLDRFYQFLREERGRKLQSIEFFQSRQGATHEVRNGVMVDTTVESTETLRQHVAEIEELFNEAGVPFNS